MYIVKHVMLIILSLIDVILIIIIQYHNWCNSYYVCISSIVYINIYVYTKLN